MTDASGEDVTVTERADHPWLGDEDGHNCVGCERYDDALRLCWPENHPPFDEWLQAADHWTTHQDHGCPRCDEGFRFWNSIAALRLREAEPTTRRPSYSTIPGFTR